MPIFFHLGISRHVLGLCRTCFRHVTGAKGYVTRPLAHATWHVMTPSVPVTWEVMCAKHDKVKKQDKGQTEENKPSNTKLGMKILKCEITRTQKPNFPEILVVNGVSSCLS